MAKNLFSPEEDPNNDKDKPENPKAYDDAAKEIIDKLFSPGKIEGILDQNLKPIYTFPNPNNTSKDADKRVSDYFNKVQKLADNRNQERVELSTSEQISELQEILNAKTTTQIMYDMIANTACHIRDRNYTAAKEQLGHLKNAYDNKSSEEDSQSMRIVKRAISDLEKELRN